MPSASRWTISPSISAAATGSSASLVGERRKLSRPIEGVAGQQLRLAVADPSEQPIAVIFDLVKPLGSVRRLVGRGRQLRLGIGRHPPLFGPGNARDAGLRLRFGRRGPPFFAVRSPDPIAIGGDLFQRTAGGDAARVVDNDRVTALRHRRGVALLDQEPVLVVPAGMFSAHPHQRPLAVQFLAVEHEFEIAFRIGRFRVGIDRSPGPAIPDQRSPGAVLPFGNDPLEPAIFERVVFDMDRQALFGRIEARTLRHRPALQHTVELEPEIVMQPARGMLLDHEGQRPRRGLARHDACRLGRLREIAFPSVLGERHGSDRSVEALTFG